MLSIIKNYSITTFKKDYVDEILWNLICITVNDGKKIKNGNKHFFLYIIEEQNVIFGFILSLGLLILNSLLIVYKYVKKYNCIILISRVVKFTTLNYLCTVSFMVSTIFKTDKNVHISL